MKRLVIPVIAASIAILTVFVVTDWRLRTTAAESVVRQPPSSQEEPEHNGTVSDLSEIGAAANEENGLMTEVTIDSSELSEIEEFISKNPVYRYRLVEINTDKLRELIRDGPSDAVQINLFPDAQVTVEAKIRRENSTGAFAGISMLGGAVQGDGLSSYVNIVVGPDGSVRAEIVSAEGSYFVKAMGAPGHHLVWQQDPDYQEIFD